jgi:hypothetical protein
MQSVYFEVKSPPESTIAVSALKNWNLDGLVEMIESFLNRWSPVEQGGQGH